MSGVQSLILPQVPTWIPASVFGACIGSFLNVVICRVPRGEDIVFTRSKCRSCGHAVRGFDNIPVLSWLLLQGRCRDCRTPIPVIYPAVELLTSVLFGVIVAWFGFSMATVFRLAFASAMVAVVFIDYEHQIIPDVITLPGTLLGLVAALLGPPGWMDAVAGALVGGGSLFAIGLIYQKVRGIEGMGGGDVKLGLMLGAFTGWQGALFTLFLASSVGALVGAILLLQRKAEGRTALPFGAFLAPAAVLGLFVAPQFFDWYLGLLRR